MFKFYMPFRGARKPLFVLSLVVLTLTVGMGAVWFLLPQLAEQLLDNIALVGLFMAIPGLLGLLIDIPLGDLADKVDRKRLIMFSLLGLIIAGAYLIRVSDTTTLLIFLLLLGSFYRIFLIPSTAYALDISPEDRRSEYLGGYTSALFFGFAIGPLLAGMLLAGGLDMGVGKISSVLILMCILSLIITVLFLKRTVKKPMSIVTALSELIRKDKIILKELMDYKKLKSTGFVILLLTFILTLYDGILWTLEPLFYTTLGIKPLYGGLILAAFIIPLIIFEIPAGRAADRFGKKGVLCLGLIIAGVFTFLFGSMQEPINLVLTAFFAASGLSLAWPALEGILADATSEMKKGEIVGVWSTSKDLGYVVGPILGGIIAEITTIGTVFTLLGALLTLVGIGLSVKKNI